MTVHSTETCALDARERAELERLRHAVTGERHFYAFLRDAAQQRAAAERAARQTSALLSTIEAQRAVTAVAYDRDAALAVVAEQAIIGFPAATGAVVELLDEDGENLVYEAVAGTLASHAGLRISAHGSLSGIAIAGRTAVRCTDTETDPRVNRDACRAAGIRSMCITPLHQAGETIGVLKVASGTPGAFDAADAHQLELLATSLTSALMHADDYARNAALLAQRTGALAALEASETRFRLTFENSPLGLIVASIDPGSYGRYLQVNPAMSAITGYTTAELTRMSFQDLQHPEDVEATELTLREMLAGGTESVRAEKRYLHKDGHTIWVSVRVAVVAPSYVMVQVEDVTAQRAANARLHQQAKLLELIPAAVIIRSLDGRIRWWNKGAQELYGWSLEAARGTVTHRLLGPADASVLAQERALAAEGRWEGQLQRLTASGRTVTVLSRQVVHRPDSNSGFFEAEVLEVNTDVTAARTAEQALAVKEQRFRAQFTHSAAGQVIRALDGTLIAVNNAFAAMVGRRPDELAGRNIDQELLSVDDRIHAQRQIAQLFAGEAESYIHDARIRHADGHWVGIEATVSLVRDTNGRPKHLIVVATDVSARRAAESARDLAAAALAERNAELEEANQLKLDLIGMLGHEISNPLSAILGYSDLLAEDLAEDSPHGRAVAVIGRQAQQLDDIVREVLAMVTIDAGNISAVRQEISVHTEIGQALKATGNGHLPVRGADARILFHPGHFQQIMVNLLSNATKYAGGASAVCVESSGSFLTVCVQDGGPGVPEEFRPRLFDRLARAERDAGTVRGTGLGLYIVRSLARANHGDVHYEPDPAGGSRFLLEAEPI
ncbi:PAS domain S-box protein [Actinoplanes sp. GCM10030250]|uniref:PAS domain S-box protein n=1 Tax=Actinoplanes sp. GCM10030250 TaxID=3273376 RepID=UPI0036092BF8